jgi:deoxyadenosine/deoxycytidine kinase
MLVNVDGDVGSGKTLLTTHIANKDTRPVFANYHINIPRFTYLEPEMLFSMKNKNEPRIVIIDEAYNWLESRLSGRPINVYSSYILFQSRKRGIDFFLTDQLFETIDLRFRKMVNIEIYCEAVPEGFEYIIQKISRRKVFKPKKLIMPYKYAETIFPLYDSWEFIDPIDKDMMFKVSQNKTSIIEDIDKIVDELLEIAEAKSYTKGIVEDYCLRNDYPDSYVKMIFNTIKARKIASD